MGTGLLNPPGRLVCIPFDSGAELTPPFERTADGGGCGENGFEIWEGKSPQGARKLQSGFVSPGIVSKSSTLELTNSP